MFLGTFGLQANLVQTGRHPPTDPPTRAPPTRAPPTHPSGRHEGFWAHSGFSPIWCEQPECQKRIILGTFGLQPSLVRTAGMPKTNLFGHTRASAQFGPNSRNADNECFWAHSGFRPIWSKPGATHPPTHPPTRAPPTRAPPTHPPTHPPGRRERFWAHSAFSPIWSEQPECQKQVFLGTSGLQPNLVRIAGVPKRNVFGHLRASAQFGPNSRNAENDCFWARSGFRPICSKPGATHPPTQPTHPGATHPGATHPPTHPPTRAPRTFLGTFRLQPNLVRTAGLPKTNLWVAPECAQKHSFSAFRLFGPNWATPECAQKYSFLAFRLFGPNWAEAGMCPKTFVAPGWVGGWVGWWRPGGWGPAGWVGGARVGGARVGGWVGGWVVPGSDQIGQKPECAQKHSFSAFRLFGPNWAEARMCQKRFVFGIPAVWTKLG